MKAGGAGIQDCRLFLRLAATTDWRAQNERMTRAFGAGHVACVLLPPVARTDFAPARDLVVWIQQAGAAALVRDDAELLESLGADGLHLGDPERCQIMRRGIGPDATLGVECPLERHAAMIAGEAGADYVAFRVTSATEEHAREILSWWHEMMVLPSVALIEEETIETESIKALCDFYSPPC
jgi:thiamine-phosphate pyrophosphorylase